PSATLFDLDMVGLRDAIGRYASMTSNPVLVEIQAEAARTLADQLKTAFHDAAPYRVTPPGELAAKGEHLHFRDSFSTDTVVTPRGFEIDVDTSEGNVAGYLRAGAYPISSPFGQALRFFEYPSAGSPSGEVVIPPRWQPVHWFTVHERWEEAALRASGPLIQAAGGRICNTYAYRLTYP
ncbi:MAG: hypothetical protein ACRDNK_21515, partial [Solirubrobacteraceae bacterium]